jgi:hypothetical protein
VCSKQPVPLAMSRCLWKRIAMVHLNVGRGVCAGLRIVATLSCLEDMRWLHPVTCLSWGPGLMFQHASQLFAFM